MGIRFTQATADFDQVSLRGEVAGAWDVDEVGDHPGMTDWERHHRADELIQSGGTFTVTGTGDIAPRLDGWTIEHTLIGAPAGLISVMIVAMLFVTGEYRRDPIGNSLLASAQRGRLLASKAA
ncbi:MAG: hypothetical protein EHM70_02355 [Chloroflexota bacterium]|nr:MAG: hypothetical protein EHM70_02355 [Chloroflexota bacterium]